MNSDQCDLFAARHERDKGIRRVAANSKEFLSEARTVAETICQRRGCVTADEVREALDLIPHHPNAYGAIFKDRRFEWTGRYSQSAVVSRHGGMQRVWRLK